MNTASQSWRTALLGAILAGTVIWSKLHSGQPLDIQTITMAAGLLGLGVAAKDYAAPSK